MSDQNNSVETAKRDAQAIYTTIEEAQAAKPVATKEGKETRQRIYEVYRDLPAGRVSLGYVWAWDVATATAIVARQQGFGATVAEPKGHVGGLSTAERINRMSAAELKELGLKRFKPKVTAPAAE